MDNIVGVEFKTKLKTIENEFWPQNIIKKCLAKHIFLDLFNHQKSEYNIYLITEKFSKLWWKKKQLNSCYKVLKKHEGIAFGELFRLLYSF